MAPAPSKCPPEQALRYNAIALQIGPTPIYDEDGRLIPIGVPEGRSKKGYVCYIVWDGRCIGIFYNWGTVVAMTVGYTGSAFKGYRSLNEAHIGWLNGPSHTPPRWPPLVRGPITTHPELYPPTMNDTPHQNDAPAAVNSPSPSPSPAASRPSSYPSSSASLASTLTFVSAQSAPSPDPLKIAPRMVSRDALDNSGTVSPPPSPGKRPLLAPSHIIAGSPVPSASRFRTPLSHDLVDTPRTTTNSIASTTTSSIVVSEGRAYAVTVGDFPGVFLDKSTAFLNAGSHPGRVVRTFATVEHAERFYAKEEQAGRVGLPCYERDLRL